MPGVTPAALPHAALLSRYAVNGGYTDCYRITSTRRVTFVDYVAAFYTTWLFKLERAILALAVNRPSSDEQVLALARGECDRFAAWSVEARASNELLLCDMHGRTRSWLRLDPPGGTDNDLTVLWFGSAVVPARTGSRGFALLLEFHKLYSVALLRLARDRAQRAAR